MHLCPHPFLSADTILRLTLSQSLPKLYPVAGSYPSDHVSDDEDEDDDEDDSDKDSDDEEANSSSVSSTPPAAPRSYRQASVESVSSKSSRDSNVHTQQVQRCLPPLMRNRLFRQPVVNITSNIPYKSPSQHMLSY